MLSDKSLAYDIAQASALAFLATTIAYNCKSLYHVHSWRVPWHSVYDTQNSGLNCDTMPNDTQQNDAQPNDTLQSNTQLNDTQQNDTQPNDTQQNDTLPNDTQQNDTLPNDTQQNDTQPYDTQQNDNNIQQNDN